jgi:peptide/nickel transport system permease protein
MSNKSRSKQNAAEESLERKSNSDQMIQIIKKLWENTSGKISILILVPICTVVLLAPVLPLQDPNATGGAYKLVGPLTEGFYLGTDHYGRDLLARTITGGRTSLMLGIMSVALSLIGGIPLGIFAGYKGGNIDEVIMRFMDVLMSFPTLIFALLILVVLGGSILNAILAVGLVFTPRVARIVRSSTLAVKNKEYVKAAEARGESQSYIMFGEILPNISSDIIVEATIRIGFGILIGTSLSFLGLGAQPPTADWGNMIAQARNYIWNSPWFLLWPSITLGLSVIGFNLLGDALRDVLDPEVTGDNL